MLLAAVHGRRWHLTLHWMDRHQRRGVGCYYHWLYPEARAWSRALGPLRLSVWRR